MTQQENPVEIAGRLRRSGEALLAGSLSELLGRYGAVTCSGSYYLDLMAWPDLDLYVPLGPYDESLPGFLELGPRMALSLPVESLRFRNFMRYPNPRLPQGLYWGVRLEQETGLRWKVDIWALPPAVIASNQAELDRLRQKLTLEKRALILQIKQALITPEGRTPSLSGYPIYCAVLDHGMTDFEEVKAYLRERGVEV